MPCFSKTFAVWPTTMSHKAVPAAWGTEILPCRHCSPQGICNVWARTLFFHCYHNSPRDCHSSKNLQPNSSICYHQGRASCFFPQSYGGISMLGELPAELSAGQETVWIHRPLSPGLQNLTWIPRVTEIILYQTNTSERFVFLKSLKNAQVICLSSLQTSLRHKQESGRKGFDGKGKGRPFGTHEDQ